MTTRPIEPAGGGAATAERPSQDTPTAYEDRRPPEPGPTVLLGLDGVAVWLVD